MSDGLPLGRVFYASPQHSNLSALTSRLGTPCQAQASWRHRPWSLQGVGGSPALAGPAPAPAPARRCSRCLPGGRGVGGRVAWQQAAGSRQSVKVW